MAETQVSLEWRSILDAVLNKDIRATLKLDQSGVVAYTDGACLKNPGGPAGWSALLWATTDMSNGKIREGAACLECYGHIPKAPTTTNNRAEIAAVLAVLSLAPPNLPLMIYSDSQYVIKVAQGIYQMNANPDLWELYRQLLSYRVRPPMFEWVRGHADNKHNERADELAGIGAFNGNKEAYTSWQASSAVEAHNRPAAQNRLPEGEMAVLRQKAQKLQAFIEGNGAGSANVTQPERSFIKDMAKRLQKNNFSPSEKQVNWLQLLAKKYRVSP